MKIILILLGMLLTCGLSGALLIYAFRANENLRRLSLHIGYAYTLVAFYLFYMQLNSAFTATALTVALPLFLAALTLLVRGLKLRPATGVVVQPPSGAVAGARSELAYLVSASAVVVLLAAWPYLLLGWGTYWHSGNEDMEDDLNGRDAYVYNLIADGRPVTMGEIFGDQSWYDFRKVVKTLPEKARSADTYRDWYAGDQNRLHYGSLAFWSELFSERHGMDMLLLQAVLKLILMTVGIFYLSRYAFAMTPITSAVASGVSSGNAFYMISFFAGHAGSLLYGALIPAFLYLVLVKDDGRHSIFHKLAFGGLIAGAILFSYPHPLTIIGLPLLIYLAISFDPFRGRIMAIQSVFQKNPVILYITIAILVIVISFSLLGLWHATEGYRLKQEGQYRAWGYTHAWLIVPLFLGLIPSPTVMEGSIFAGSLGEYAYWVFCLFSSLILAILGSIYFKTKIPQKTNFFLIFGFFWIAEYLVFKYFIVDSYYLYKFLYTNQFILVIGVVGYVVSSQSRVVKLLCATIILANLSSDIAMAYGSYRRPYNQTPKSYNKLAQLDRGLLEKSFIELSGGYGIATRQTLKAQGIRTTIEPRDADYFIMPSGFEYDIVSMQFTETVAEIGGFAVKRVPVRNFLMIRTDNLPEQFPADPVLKNTVFRWVGHGLNDNVGIYVIRPSPVEEMAGRYLRVCFQKGPSAENAIKIIMSTATKEVLRKFVLDSGVHCEWIPAEQVIGAQQPILIHSGAKGKSLLPYDDRILLYRVFAVGWADRIYDDMTMSFFNATPDIVKKSPKKAEGESTPDFTIQLGQGWEAYEKFGGDTFRWAGRSTELVLTGGDKDGVANIVVELEPGPSHGNKYLELEAWDRAGNLIFTSAAVSGRNTVVLPLGYRKHQTSVYVLKTKSLNLPQYGDPRILNYRVFSVALDENRRERL